MIFRVVDKKLYQIKIRIDNEDEFITKNNTLNLIKVSENELPKYTGEEVDEVFYQLDDNNNIIIDTDRTSKRAEQYKEEKKQKYLERLIKLCDLKTLEVKDMLTGQKVTEGLVERYKIKDEIARAYLKDGSYADDLKVEADLNGMTVDELSKLIVQLADKYKSKLNYFYSLIEAFRVKTKKLINEYKFDIVNNIINTAYTFDANITPDDIKALFKTINDNN